MKINKYHISLKRKITYEHTKVQVMTVIFPTNFIPYNNEKMM